jgi:hypothetical protein
VYGTPPLSTNVRFVASINQLTNDVVRVAPASSQDAALSRYRVANLAAYGLPMCTVVTPAAAQTVNASGIFECYDSSDRIDVRAAKFVVVDIPCAEAVLRGADIFAPGVLSSCFSYNVGDEVVVLAVVNAAYQPTKSSFHDANEFWATTPPLDVGGAAGGDARRSFGPTVVIAQATCLMARADVVVRGSKGVAFRINWSPCHHPSRDHLADLLRRPLCPLRAAAGAGAADTASSLSSKHHDVFLQNWSSMVPIVWLTDDLTDTNSGYDTSEAVPSNHLGAAPRRWTFLDACAAPGGKTSLLIDRCLGAMRDGGSVSDFHVTTCERSKQRSGTLKTLLESHFSSSILSAHVTCHVGDVVQWLARNTALSYDRIVLDPPCTGLGLRPKLLPHLVPQDEVLRSAQYQRSLFAACWSRLAVNGRLSYSTCTISAEENEETVAWVLGAFPDAELMPATTKGQQALTAKFGCRGFTDPLHTASTLERRSVLCCRFGPTPEDDLLDGVGFFAALFHKRA